MAMGRKNWMIPDCELPPAGEGALKGHESVIVVNDAKKPVSIRVTLFYSDKNCEEGIVWTVPAATVRCLRMNDAADMCGKIIPLETQYAMRLAADRAIVVQYGRLDNRQTNLAYYTTLGYSE